MRKLKPLNIHLKKTISDLHHSYCYIFSLINKKSDLDLKYFPVQWNIQD